MKVKKTHANERETVPRRIPWDADSFTAGGPTSIDVLLMWLLTPGKFELFHSKQRGKAMQEIRALLERQGIYHRSEASIRSKINGIEKKYVSAKLWLKERKIRSQDVVNGKVDGDIEATVLAMCPNFCEIMPVLQYSGLESETEPAQTSVNGQEEDTDSDVGDKRVRLMQKRGAENESPSRPSKRRQTAVATPSEPLQEKRSRRTEARVLNCVQQTLTYGKFHSKELDLSGKPSWFQRSDERAVVVRDLDVPLPPDVQRQVADVKLQHAKKRSQAVLEHEDKMMECDVDVKRGRAQVQLLLEKVLARETMKKEGVPKDEINDILPLKEP